MPERTTARRPATVSTLMDAAERTFAEQGVRGTSIAQVCEAAGFTRGAFYSNFRTKTELLDALYRRRHDALAAVVAHGLVELRDAADPVEELVRRVMAFGGDAYRQWFLVTMEFTALGATDAEVAARLAPARARTRELVCEVVAETLRLAGREPLVPVPALGWSVVTWFLGWQAQRIGEPDREQTAFQDGRAADALRALLLTGSRPAAAPENGGVTCG